MSEIAAHELALPNPAVAVWDPWVRLFHWSLVLAIAAAAVTGFLADATWLRLHVAGGLAATALVLARIVWGFLGATHARFSDFVLRPADMMAHLRSGDHARRLGHNALGGLMILALMAAVLALGLTGLAVLGGALKTGPLASALSFETGTSFARVHRAFAIGLLWLVALHVTGVVFESVRGRENLVRAMVTGFKDSRPGDYRPRPAHARGLTALAVIAALGAGLTATNATLSALPVRGLPVAALDPTFEAECSECHIAYHPSLLPAAAWTAMMATLDDHFGENASLDDATTAEIAAWLAAHAAETADTRPARLMSRTAPEAPFTLTETPFWKRTHRRLPDALYQTRAVGSRSNCAACHSDAATGLFSPFAISIPEETTR